MSDFIIGPGTPCWSCGADYGAHDQNCRAQNERKELERVRDEERGAALLAALDARDPRWVGQILRGPLGRPASKEAP